MDKRVFPPDPQGAKAPSRPRDSSMSRLHDHNQTQHTR